MGVDLKLFHGFETFLALNAVHGIKSWGVSVLPTWDVFVQFIPLSLWAQGINGKKTSLVGKTDTPKMSEVTDNVLGWVYVQNNGFSINGTELSLNSVNSTNSENLRNH